MKKRIKKYGNGLVVHFDKEDCEVYNIKEGQIYDLEMNLIKKRGKK